jgi:hypothetical protein
MSTAGGIIGLIAGTFGLLALALAWMENQFLYLEEVVACY